MIEDFYGDPLSINNITEFTLALHNSLKFISGEFFALLLIFGLDLPGLSLFIYVFKTWSHLLELLQRRQYELIVFKHANSIVSLQIQFLRRKSTVHCCAARVHWRWKQSLGQDSVINGVAIIVDASIKLVVQFQTCRLFDNSSLSLGGVTQGWDTFVFGVDAELNLI